MVRLILGDGMVIIVKRRGRKEKFDERKIYASCYAACLSSHLDRKYTERVCEAVTKHIKSWIKNKKIISSSQIFKIVEKTLRKHDRDAAFMYKTHRDIS